MIILVGGLKGGTGKSTIATNIATCLAHKKHSILLVDGNPLQKTSSNWAERREENNLPHITCVEKSGNIRNAIKELAGKFEYIVIDTGGQDSKEFRTAMLAANLIITPVRASQADIETLLFVSQLLDEARDLNPELNAIVVITNASTNPKVKSTEETKALIKNIEGIKVAKSIIYQRKAYEDAIPTGAGVVELDDKKASTEIKKLVKEILK